MTVASERPACQVRFSEGRACRVRLSEGPACQVRCTQLDHPSHFSGHDRRAPPALGGTCLSGPLHPVGSSIPLQRARRACPSEGPAPPRPSPHAGREITFPPRAGGCKGGCQVRGTSFDYPFPSKGPACQVRCTPLDHPSHFSGHDERAPPSGHDRHAPPTPEGPACQVRDTNENRLRLFTNV